MQGHVDGTGELLALESVGEGNWWIKVRVPAELDRYLVFKGSVAIDGISLTIASLDSDVLSATVIPHTFQHTNLHTRLGGSRLTTREATRAGLLSVPQPRQARKACSVPAVEFAPDRLKDVACPLRAEICCHPSKGDAHNVAVVQPGSESLAEP